MRTSARLRSVTGLRRVSLSRPSSAPRNCSGTSGGVKYHELHLDAVRIQVRLGISCSDRGNAGADSHSSFIGSMIYTFERAPQDGEGPPACYARVLDIIKPITPIDAQYDGYVPPPVKGNVLHTRRGVPMRFLALDLCELPTLNTSHDR
jgi:hypothetical protein